MEREQACSPLTYPSPVQAHVARNGEQPAAEMAAGTVPEALLNDGHHRVLERVRCVIRVSQEAQAETEQWCLVAVVQLSKSLGATGGEPGHQDLVVHVDELGGG